MTDHLRFLIIWLRNAKVWRKIMIPSLLGNFGEPLFFLLAFGYGLGAYIGNIQGLPYIAFLASGIVCSSAVYSATFESLYGAYTRMSVQGSWHAILTSPMTVPDIIRGEMMWMGTKSTISGAAILSVAVLLGHVHNVSAILALPVLFLCGCCYGGMGLIVTSFARNYDFFLYYFTLVITPMILLSGVFFPVNAMPPWVQTVAAFFPLTHVVNIVRPLIIEVPMVGLYQGIGIIALYTYGSYRLAVWTISRRLLD